MLVSTCIVKSERLLEILGLAQKVALAECEIKKNATGANKFLNEK